MITAIAHKQTTPAGQIACVLINPGSILGRGAMAPIRINANPSFGFLAITNAPAMAKTPVPTPAYSEILDLATAEAPPPITIKPYKPAMWWLFYRR